MHRCVLILKVHSNSYEEKNSDKRYLIITRTGATEQHDLPVLPTHPLLVTRVEDLLTPQASETPTALTTSWATPTLSCWSWREASQGSAPLSQRHAQSDEEPDLLLDAGQLQGRVLVHEGVQR